MGIAPGDEHLDRLLLAGDTVSGSYTPRRFELRLGTSATHHEVVHLHEAHHAALNDSTAWGSALHLLARLGDPFTAAFRSILDACRRTHESFATFSSISLLACRGADVEQLLAPYPAYVPLYRSLDSATSLVDGPNRRYLLATGAARVAMQTPILDAFNRSELDELRASAFRRIDTPDARWSLLVSRPATWWTAVSEHADDAVRRANGDAALHADTGTSDPLHAVEREHDDAWGVWERAVYNEFAVALASASAQVLGFDGHQAPTAVALEVARSIDPSVGVRAAPSLSAARDDRTLAASVVEQARHVVNADRVAARLVAVEVSELVDIVDITSRIEEVPTLVVTARLPTRLRAMFDWCETDAIALAETSVPIVAVRVFSADDASETVDHMPVPDPGYLSAVRDAWGARGPFVACVAASCLIDTAWQRRWLRPLLSTGKLFVLVDIELDRFVPSWVRDGIHVRVAGIEITDTAGPRRAVGIVADDPRVLWLAIGDGLGMDLLVRQLQETAGLHLDIDPRHLDEWEDDLAPVITHLLATDPFFDLEGLEGVL